MALFFMWCGVFTFIVVFAFVMTTFFTHPESFFEPTSTETEGQTFIADEPYDKTKPLCSVVLVSPVDFRIIRELVVQVYEYDEYSIRYRDPNDQKMHTLFFEDAIVDISKIS